MALVYRRWKENDLPSIQQLLLSTWIESYSSFIPKEDLKTYHDATYNLSAMKKLFKDPDVNGFVAELDGAIIGTIRTWYAKSEKRFYVSSLYIKSDQQGKGIGRALMTVAAKEAQKLNADKIWLGVMQQNKSALEWYKKYGFEVVEEAPFAMGSTTVNHFIGFVLVQSVIRH